MLHASYIYGSQHTGNRFELAGHLCSTTYCRSDVNFFVSTATRPFTAVLGIVLSLTTVFTCRVDSTGIPDVSISEITSEGGSEEDGNDVGSGFSVQLFKDGRTLQHAKRLCYGIRQDGRLLVQWTALLVKDELFIHVPESAVPEGGKECFVSLLDYAELDLNCQKVYVCCRKERRDRADVLRSFAFLGFEVVPPGLSPVENSNVLVMVMPLG
ncbi:ornithine decarboxylase antizyme 3-like [Corticium candelabrum]|uniref:ornithine decarboxylase antizyme 3-like n=1 Tax=Corticium candelabrum TaxID=121492 RepID=UPI002E256A0F|nr:ornithine decarboxylase antizyme 3-like [Corticium candelabrum]